MNFSENIFYKNIIEATKGLIINNEITHKVLVSNPDNT